MLLSLGKNCVNVQLCFGCFGIKQIDLVPVLFPCTRFISPTHKEGCVGKEVAPAFIWPIIPLPSFFFQITKNVVNKKGKLHFTPLSLGFIAISYNSLKHFTLIHYILFYFKIIPLLNSLFIGPLKADVSVMDPYHVNQLPPKLAHVYIHLPRHANSAKKCHVGKNSKFPLKYDFFSQFYFFFKKFPALFFSFW